MTATLTVQDETIAGAGQEMLLTFTSERITVDELIRSRVYQEVKDYHARQTTYFRGLVQPTDAERTLNGYRLRQPRRIDWEEQYALAIAAFQRNGFIILVNEHQVDDLEEDITIQPDTLVTFLKLIPLVGG